MIGIYSPTLAMFWINFGVVTILQPGCSQRFNVGNGHYEYVRMSFVLKSRSRWWWIIYYFCLGYIDNIIIMPAFLQEYFVHLTQDFLWTKSQNSTLSFLNKWNGSTCECPDGRKDETQLLRSFNRIFSSKFKVVSDHILLKWLMALKKPHANSFGSWIWGSEYKKRNPMSTQTVLREQKYILRNKLFPRNSVYQKNHRTGYT